MFKGQYKKAHLYFWILAIIIFVIGLLRIDLDDTLDINVHDTYYVIQASHFNLFFTIIYLLIGFIYWSFKKLDIELHPTLTSLHTVITIASVILTIVIPEINNLFFDGFYYGINAILFVLSLIIVVAQFIFITNILRGMFLRLKKN